MIEGATRSIADHPQQTRQLDRVATAAERLANYNLCLQAFVDRYHGNPQSAQQLGAPTSVPSGHVGHIAKLEDELQRLDRLVSEIQEIG